MKKFLSILLCVCVCLIYYSLNVYADDSNIEIIWENDPNAPAIGPYDGSTRFTYASKNSQEVYHYNDEYSSLGNIDDEQWEWMKKVTFYIDIKADSAPTIKLLDGWWQKEWTPGQVTVGDYMIDNGDGTYTLIVNLVNDPLTSIVTEGDLTAPDIDIKDLLIISFDLNINLLRMYFKKQQFTEGANCTIDVLKNEDKMFVCDGLFNEFLYAEVDGNKLETSDYDAVEGSTKVTLHSSYLNTLTTGTHTLTLAFLNGFADTEFTIYRPSNSAPNTPSDPAPQYEVPNTGVN